jgi:glycosyltransferase involved in cell wall biosynthesis
MSQILVVSGDIVNNNMGGVGVRNWELAHTLSEYCRITLAIPNQTDLSSHSVEIVSFDLENGDLKPYCSDVDAIVTHGYILHFHPYLRDLGIPLAVDLYVPSLLEGLVWHNSADWGTWIPAYEEYLRVQLELIRSGDFFFCASERQRDYWLGWLHAQKRINPHTYRADPSLRKLIDVVPFGLPEEKPIASRPVMKGVEAGIDQDDKVILWSGGLWDWLDPLTLIRAVDQLAPEYPQIKLYFMGTRHPNPVVGGMTMPEKCKMLAQELGLIDKVVFFGDWVPYHERGGYLAEADLAVVSHPGHIETHFSFRTRVLDCIWVGLPIITTSGDTMADMVNTHNLGLTVPPYDVKALASAIKTILFEKDREKYASSFGNIQRSLTWKNVIQPLAGFCMHPHLAPDKGCYLTETERMSRDKDAFHERVLHEQSSYIAEVEKELGFYRKWLPLRALRWLYRKLGLA